MASSIIILGGPKHGQRFHMQAGSSLSMVMAFDRLPMRFAGPWHDENEPVIQTISYPIYYLRLNPERSIGAAVHPDISEETGRRLLGDLVYATWERHGYG